METFRSVALTACFLGIVIAVFSSLYPSEKFAGQIKIIFSLIFILCLAKPIAEGKLRLPEISETVAASSEYYSGLNANADEYFIKSVENNISTALEDCLREAEIYPLEIKTSINISDNYRISIREVEIMLDDPNDSEAARRCVSDRIGEDAAVSVVTAAGNEGLQ